MNAKLILGIIAAAVTCSVQAQINVGANTINGVNASVISGYQNTNDANNSAIGGYSNWALTNGSLVSIGGGGYNVVGGLGATIAGGYDNFNTNNFSTIGGGIGHTISANAATIPGGAYAVADKFGQFAYSSQKISVAGDSQSSLFVLRNSTTSGTTTELSLSVGTPAAQMLLKSGAVWSFRALITAKRAATGDTRAWEINGLIKNIGGTTTLVNSTTTQIGNDAGASAWTAVMAADDTTDALVINVTGAAFSTISWTAAVTTSELN
jgi:hypothetical protein